MAFPGEHAKLGDKPAYPHAVVSPAASLAQEQAQYHFSWLMRRKIARALLRIVWSLFHGKLPHGWPPKAVLLAIDRILQTFKDVKLGTKNACPCW